jgi:hypothetical protein
MKSNKAIRVGKPQVDVEAPTHVAGTSAGNDPGHYEKMEGHLADGRSTAERSTGINHDARNPIDPKSPNLSPA